MVSRFRYIIEDFDNLEQAIPLVFLQWNCLLYYRDIQHLVEVSFVLIILFFQDKIVIGIIK